jgi:hypothetical protein
MRTKPNKTVSNENNPNYTDKIRDGKIAVFNDRQ